MIAAARLPNMSVKGTRRPHRFLKAGGLFGFVGFGLVLQPARPLLLRWASFAFGISCENLYHETR